MRASGLVVLLWLYRLPLSSEASRAFLWVVILYVFGKILLRHTEILIFKLLYSSFEGSVLVPELNELGVNLIDCGNFWCYVLKCSCSELPVFGVALFHDVLDLSRDQLIVVMPVVFQYTFNKLQPLAKGLILDLELETIGIFLLEISLNLFNILSELGICLEQICDGIDTMNEPFCCRIHLVLVLLEIETSHCSASFVAHEGLAW